MKNFLYVLLFSAIMVGCNKPSADNEPPPGGGGGQEPELKKLVEKIDLIQNGTILGSFEFTYNTDKTIKTLAVKLTKEYKSNVCNLPGYTETFTFDTKSTVGKLRVSRDRLTSVPSAASVSFDFDLDSKGRVVSGVNRQNEDMTASYEYNAEGVLTKFEQGVLAYQYSHEGGAKFVKSLFLGEEDGRMSYSVSKPSRIFSPQQINIDLNMLIVDMKSASSLEGGIAFLDPAFLGMFGYLGERESVVATGCRGFKSVLQYMTDSEGSPIKIVSSITVGGKPVVNSYEIKYVK